MPKKMRSFIVLLITVFICGLSVKPAFSDDLYWINGGGYWNNSKHWSLSSGGESCNRIPTKNDNVIFDNNSFTGNGQKIIINDKTFCNDFHWNVTNYEATLKSSFFLFRGITKAEVNIGGNLFINDGYVDDYHGKFNFSSSGRVNLFIEPEINGDINVNCKGKVIVESDIRTYGIVNVIAGELDLNKKEIKTSSFVSSGNNQRKINFNESRIIADEVDFSDTRNLKYIGDKIQIEIPKGYNKREIRIGNLPISILRSGTRAPLAQDSITSTNITCYNQTTGTVTIAISGGTAPYTYSLYRTPELSLISSANFSDTVYTFNNVAAASYVVRVEDSNFGIIQTSPETVSEPARLMAGNITINSGLSCFDGSDAELQAAASGGTPPYTYQWQEDIGGTWTNLTGETSNVLSNIGQGIYQVRVNDQNSCGPVSSQKVFNKAFEPSLVPDSISITGVSSTNTCSGVNLGSITISATGGTGTMSYAIVRTSDSDSTNNSTGVFNNLQADTYRVYAIDANDCAKRESDVTINSLASPTANITPDPANACPGMALALNGNPVLGDGTSFVTHAWTGTGADSLDNTAIQNPNFTNSTAGNYNLTYTVTDDNGCSGSDNIVVAVGDTVVPAVACQNITVQLDTTGNVSITAAQINNGSSDNCTNTADLILTVSPDSFSCADIGPNPVILTVEDASGNSSSCTSTVTVLDRLPPIPSCKNITVYLDNIGTALITPADINDGSFDNCTDIADLILTVSPDSFSCDQIGSRQVILTVQDTSGNTSNCTSTVTVSDTIIPVISCPDDTAVNAQGSCSANVNNLTPLIVDNCGSSLTTTWTMTGATVGTGTVDVSGSTFSGGSTQVIYTVTDTAGNTATCDFRVTVNDTIPPVPGCKNITVNLDSTGTALITPADINDGSFDNCTDTADLILTVSPDSFSCDQIGPRPVTLTVEDTSGNSFSCISTVTVLDRLPPIPSCKNITVNLDSTGTALITPADINDGSFDNCTDIADLILTVSPDSFSCDQIGSRQVILTVQDTSGNTSNCTSTVTVSDMITPVIYCPDDTAVNAQGSCSANVNNLSPLIVDNCGSSLTPTWTMTGATVGTGTVDVSGSTFSGGSTEVTYTVTDGGNNTHSCSFYVTVNDTIPPVPGCKNITVYLDSTGTALITPADINDGSSDNCTDTADLILTVSPDSFSCADIGPNPVILTVQDTSGNTSNCTSTVTVSDMIIPVISCPEDTAVNAQGSCSANVNNLTPLIVDNCGSSLTTTWTMTGATVGTGTVDVSGSTFSGGSTQVIYTVTDTAGNTATCDFRVTVNDTIPPVPGCKNITVYLDSTGTALITPADINDGSSDNCTDTADLILTVSPDSFSCDQIGPNPVILTVQDTSGNTSNCTSTVTVSDMIIPVISCPDNTTVNNQLGSCSAIVDNLTPLIVDNCGSSLTTTWTMTGATVGTGTVDVSGSTFRGGSTRVTYTVTDTAGNTATCNFDVIVNDTEDPVLNCPADVVAAENGGTCTAIVNNIAPVIATDNCSILSQTWTMTGATTGNSPNTGINDASGETFRIGETRVTYTLGDTSGNTTTCNFSVEINDEVNAGLIDADQTICYNTAPALFTNETSADVCGGFTYQWQKRSESGTWTDIPGAMGDSYLETTNLTERTYYNRKAIPTLNFPTAYSDTVIVNIDPAPTANAGNDTALCHNTAYHVQNADTSESSGVTWEILVGNGTLNNVNIIDPEYTPDPLNEVDTVQLVLHALGNGACIESTDTVKIIYASEFNVTIGKSTPFLIDSTSTHIDVALKVSNHHFVALLGFYLVSPLDSIVELKRICNLIGTSNLRDISCEFYNDSLSLPIVSPCHMTSGRYRFEDDWKRKLHGQDPANGNWRIMITDTLSLGSTGTLDSAVIRFIDNNSNSQLETVVYQDTSINLNINGYPGGHTDPPAITEYNLSITGLATLCYNTCDANVIATAIGGMPPYVSYVWSRDRDFSTVYVDNDTADLCSGKYYLQVTDAMGCTVIDSVNIGSPPDIRITNTFVEQVPCNGGDTAKIMLEFAGGTGSLTYSYAGNSNTFNSGDTITNLTAGTYDLTIQDAMGCVKDTSITISEPDPIMPGFTVTDVTCNGINDGTITSTPINGTPPYDFVWNNSASTSVSNASSSTITGLSAGTYEVTITDDNLCTRVADTSLIEPESLILTIDKRDKHCVSPQTRTRDASKSKGQAIASASGGTPFTNSQTGAPEYNYSWTAPGFTSNNDTIDELDAKDYTVRVLDAMGCFKDSTITIVDDPSFDITGLNITIDDTSVCWYDSLTVQGNYTGNADTMSYYILQDNVDDISDTVPLSDNPFTVHLNVESSGNMRYVEVYNEYCIDDERNFELTYTPDIALDIIDSLDENPNDDTIFLIGEIKTNLIATVTNPSGITFNWFEAGSSIEVNKTMIEITPDSSAYYSVVARTEDCIDTSRIRLEYIPLIDPNTGFSPNGDGINDSWKIKDIEKFPNNIVTVFNRWGVKVFEQKGYKNSDPSMAWDGSSSSGEELPSGTYYYIIILNAEGFKPITGPITIVR